MQKTKNEYIELLKDNLKDNRKVKHSNLPLIQMLEMLKGNPTIVVESTRGNENIPNRGSLAEVVAKMIINQYAYGVTEGKRSTTKESDYNTMNMSSELRESLGFPKTQNLEIKFSTGFAYASPKSNKARYTLVINEVGAYLVRSTELNKNTSNKIVANQPNGIRLELLSELLGF